MKSPTPLLDALLAVAIGVLLALALVAWGLEPYLGATP